VQLIPLEIHVVTPNNAKKSALQTLSKTCKKFEREINKWKTKPSLRESQQFGIFDPETTTFILDVSARPSAVYDSQQSIGQQLWDASTLKSHWTAVEETWRLFCQKSHMDVES
jgi:hypothetical protein